MDKIEVSAGILHLMACVFINDIEKDKKQGVFIGNEEEYYRVIDAILSCTKNDSKAVFEIRKVDR